MAKTSSVIYNFADHLMYEPDSSALYHIPEYLRFLKLDHPEVYQAIAEQIMVVSGIICVRDEYLDAEKQGSSRGFVYFKSLAQPRLLNQLGATIYALQQVYAQDDANAQALHKAKFFSFLPKIELKLTAATLGLTSSAEHPLPEYAIEDSPTFARNSVHDNLMVGSQDVTTERNESLANCQAIDIAMLQDNLTVAAQRYFLIADPESSDISNAKATKASAKKTEPLPDEYFLSSLEFACQQFTQAINAQSYKELEDEYKQAFHIGLATFLVRPQLFAEFEKTHADCPLFKFWQQVKSAYQSWIKQHFKSDVSSQDELTKSKSHNKERATTANTPHTSTTLDAASAHAPAPASAQATASAPDPANAPNTAQGGGQDAKRENAQDNALNKAATQPHDALSQHFFNFSLAELNGENQCALWSKNLFRPNMLQRKFKAISDAAVITESNTFAFAAFVYLVTFKIRHLLFVALEPIKDPKKATLHTYLNIALDYSLLFFNQPSDAQAFDLKKSDTKPRFISACNKVLTISDSANTFSRANLFDRNCVPEVSEVRKKFEQNRGDFTLDEQKLIEEYLRKRSTALNNNDEDYYKALIKVFALGWQKIGMLFTDNSKTVKPKEEPDTLRSFTWKVFHERYTKGDAEFPDKLQEYMDELGDTKNDDDIVSFINEQDSTKQYPKLNRDLFEAMISIQIKSKTPLNRDIDADKRGILMDFYKEHLSSIEKDANLYQIWKTILFADNPNCKDFIHGLYNVTLTLMSERNTNESKPLPVFRLELKLKKDELSALAKDDNQSGLQFFNLMYGPTLRELARSKRFILAFTEGTNTTTQTWDPELNQPFPLLDFADYIKIRSVQDPQFGNTKITAPKQLDFYVSVESEQLKSRILKWEMPIQTIGISMVDALEQLISPYEQALQEAYTEQEAQAQNSIALQDGQTTTSQAASLADKLAANQANGQDNGTKAKSPQAKTKVSKAKIADQESDDDDENTESLPPSASVLRQILLSPKHESLTLCLNPVISVPLKAQLTINLDTKINNKWKFVNSANSNPRQLSTAKFNADADFCLKIHDSDDLNEHVLNPDKLYAKLGQNVDKHEAVEQLAAGFDVKFDEFKQQYALILFDLFHGNLQFANVTVCVQTYQECLNQLYQALQEAEDDDFQFRQLLLNLLNLGVFFNTFTANEAYHQAVVFPWNVMRLYAQSLKQQQWAQRILQILSTDKYQPQIESDVLMQIDDGLSVQSYGPNIVLRQFRSDDGRTGSNMHNSWFSAQHQTLIDNCLVMPAICKQQLQMHATSTDIEVLKKTLETKYLPYFVPLKSELNILLYRWPSLELITMFFDKLTEHNDSDKPSLLSLMTLNLYVYYDAAEDKAGQINVYQNLFSHLNTDQMRTNLLLKNSNNFKHNVRLCIIKSLDELDAQASFGAKSNFVAKSAFDLTVLFDLSKWYLNDAKVKWLDGLTESKSGLTPSFTQAQVFAQAHPHQAQGFAQPQVFAQGYVPGDNTNVPQGAMVDVPHGTMVEPASHATIEVQGTYHGALLSAREQNYLPNLLANSIFDKKGQNSLEFYEALVSPQWPELMQDYANLLFYLVNNQDFDASQTHVPCLDINNAEISSQLNTIIHCSKVVLCIDGQINPNMLSQHTNDQAVYTMQSLYNAYNATCQRNIMLGVQSSIGQETPDPQHLVIGFRQVLDELCQDENEQNQDALNELRIQDALNQAKKISGSSILSLKNSLNGCRELFGLVCSQYLLQAMQELEKNKLKQSTGFKSILNGMLFLDDNLDGLYQNSDKHADILGLSVYQYNKSDTFKLTVYVAESKFRTQQQTTQAAEQLIQTCRPLRLLLNTGLANTADTAIMASIDNTDELSSTLSSNEHSSNTGSNAISNYGSAVQSQTAKDAVADAQASTKQTTHSLGTSKYPDFDRQVVLIWIHNCLNKILEPQCKDISNKKLDHIKRMFTKLLAGQVETTIVPLNFNFFVGKDTEFKCYSDKQLRDFMEYQYSKLSINRHGMLKLIDLVRNNQTSPSSDKSTDMQWVDSLPDDWKDNLRKALLTKLS